MKKIRTPQEGAGAALSARSTTASDTMPQMPPEGVLSGFSATAEQFIAASQSDATKRAYASDLRHFFANGGAIPASPLVLAEYLANCAEKLSVASFDAKTAPWGGYVSYDDGYALGPTYRLEARSVLFDPREEPNEGTCTPARKTITVQ